MYNIPKIEFSDYGNAGFLFFSRPYRAVLDGMIYTLSNKTNIRIITRINVPIKFRGMGIGTKLLKACTDWADRADRADNEGIILVLNASPSGGLNRQQLVAWYERNGFQELESGMYERLPHV